MRDEYVPLTGALRAENQSHGGPDGENDARGFQPPLPGHGWSPVRSSLPRLGGSFPEAGYTHPDSRPLSGRGQHAPGTGRADGSPVGPDGSIDPGGGPRFDTSLKPGGYTWWYVDGISSDGRYGITVIAMIGSVFSTYYAWSGQKDPLDHCVINVALYSRRSSHWAMTERGKHAVDVAAHELVVGPSQLRWDGNALVIEIDETTCPIPTSLKGTIRLHPEALTREVFALDASSQHQWWPIAPQARIEVEMTHPDVRWSGQGYFDTNRGNSPLEKSFRSWNWSYARIKDRAVLFYDTLMSTGASRSISIVSDKSGRITPLDPPPVSPLPRTRWLIPQETRADAGYSPRLLRRLEDTPFYARSMLSTRLLGEDTIGIHERLSLDRLANPLVRIMIPFRNPRAWR